MTRCLMKNKNMKRSTSVVELIMIMVIVIICNVPTFFSYFANSSDEMCYLTQAGFLAGYNWNEVNRMFSYYSFGASIIPAIVMKLVTDSIVAYRIMLFLNSFLLVGCFFVTKNVFRLFFPSEKKIVGLIISFIVTCYPSNICYSDYILAENYLTLCFWLSLLFFLKYISEFRVKYLICLSLSTTYIFFIHQRSIGILVATVSCTVIIMLRERKYLHIMMFIACVGCLFGALYLYKIYSKEILWMNATSSSGNDFAGVINNETVSWMLSKEFYIGVIKAFIGRIWYLSLATVGSFIVGLCYIVKELYNIIKEKDIGRIYGLLFVVISLVLETMICLYFAWRPSRIDVCIQGRYIEAYIGPIIMFGFYMIYDGKFVGKRITEVTMIILLFSTKIVEKFSIEVSLYTKQFYMFDNSGLFFFINGAYHPGIFLKVFFVIGVAVILFFSMANKTCVIKIYTFLLFLCFLLNICAYHSSIINRNMNNVEAVLDISESISNIEQTIGYYPQNLYATRIQQINREAKFVQISDEERRNASYILIENGQEIYDFIYDEYDCIIKNDILSLWKINN